MERLNIISVAITNSVNGDIISASCVAEVSPSGRKIIGELSIGSNLHVCIIEKDTETLFIIECEQINQNMVGKEYDIIDVIHTKEYIETLKMR